MMREKIIPAFLGMQPPGFCAHFLLVFLSSTQNGTSWQAPLSAKFISGVFENNLNTHNALIPNHHKTAFLSMTKNGSSRWAPLSDEAVSNLSAASQYEERPFLATDVAFRQA